MGFPSPAKDYEEERISLDKEFITHPNATYFMRMEGTSMINAFISPGSLLVVDRSVKPRNMDIIVANLNGEMIVRYLRKNDIKSWLVPANSKMQDQPITADMEMVIWGVVIAVVMEPQKMAGHVRAC